MSNNNVSYKFALIGKIPKDWEVVRLENLIKEVIMGQAPPSASYNREGKGLPLVKATEFGEIYPHVGIWTTNPIKKVDENFILLSIAGTIGLVNKGIKCSIGRSVAGIKPNLSKIDFDYLFYYLKFISKKLRGRGSSQKILITEDIVKLEIIKPKLLPEQKAIAQVLSTVDEAIQKVDEIIAKTERLKKGLMQQLLTGKIRVKEVDGKLTLYKETEFKDTEIGKIPKDWEVVRLEEICEKIKAGGTPLTSKQEYWNGNIPFVKIEDITSCGKYLTKTSSFISEIGLKNSNAWLIPENSLLLAMYGSLGEVAINKIPVAANQAILGIIPKDKEDVEFLFYWFLFFKRFWKKYAKPTTQANLTAEIIKNSLVNYPKKEERKAIAQVLSTIDKRLEFERKRKEKLERIKKGLMNDLLTGRKRMKI